MEDIKTLEEATLEEAMQKGQPVKVIYTNGYQAMVKIRDFDCEVIRGTAMIRGEEKDWMIYRHAVSTIELG